MFVFLFIFFFVAFCLVAYQAIEYYKEGKHASALINGSLFLAFVGLEVKLAVKPLVPIPDGAKWLTDPIQTAIPAWAPDALGWAAVALLVIGITFRIRDWTGRQDEDEDENEGEDAVRPAGGRYIKTDQ